MFRDNWVRSTRHAGITNQPQLINATLVSEWEDDQWRYRRMSDGKTYRQHQNYWVHSPYGWEEV